MKGGSDVFRASSIQGIMKHAREKGIFVLVCEPRMVDGELFGSDATHDLEGFRRRACVIMFGSIWKVYAPTHCDY